MLKKLRLKQTDTYERAVATREIVQMILPLIRGEVHAKSLGSEQGDIEHWDDFIVEHDDGTIEHQQVKQQTTDFSDKDVIRGVKSRGPNKGDPDDLSVLDEAMESLGKWTAANPVAAARKERKFKIVVPGGGVLIKKSISVDNLEKLCNTDIIHLTDSKGFSQLTAVDKASADICTWLKTWCDYTDNDAVLAALRNVEIVITGNLLAYEQQTRNLLGSCFTQADKVEGIIHGFIDENSTYTNAIKPRDVLAVLNQYRLPGSPDWTQYQFDAATCKISGTHDVLNGEIESPSQTVPALWNPAKASVFRLKGNRLPTKLGRAMVRLILHLQNLSTAHISESAAWLEASSGFVGGTLGINEDDCASTSVRMIEGGSMHSSSDQRLLAKADDMDTEADNLNQQMDAIVWDAIKSGVSQKIQGMTSSELRTELDQRWNSWLVDLNAYPEKRLKFLSAMLTLNAEGKDIFSELRFGLKTVKLIKEGIFMLLVVAVGIDASDVGWENIGNGSSISTCALQHWSGPAGLQRKPRKITDEDGLDKLLGLEPSKILLFPGTDMSSAEVTSDLIANSKVPVNNIASPHRPILITNNRKLKKMISEGKLEPIRDFLKQLLDDASAGRTMN